VDNFFDLFIQNFLTSPLFLAPLFSCREKISLKIIFNFFEIGDSSRTGWNF